MTRDDLPDSSPSDGGRSARPPRSTPELIVELRQRAAGRILVAIALVNRDVTQFVFASDDNPLSKLNALIGGGGHPIGIVSVRIDGGCVEYDAHPFVEYRHRPHALAYLQSLRLPFLTLLHTHLERMPDNPRMN